MAGYEYPHYFERELARLSNPAQSLQAITVGSISHSDFETHDYIAIGKKGEISSFSRIGPGMWDSIKPDLVEYGGTHAKNKSDNTLTTPEEVCTDLLRRSPEGPAHGPRQVLLRPAHRAANPQRLYCHPKRLGQPHLCGQRQWLLCFCRAKKEVRETLR